jgi:16S rRNA G1207 methylase RsmC
LELNAGTGIAGITVKKWTKCESITMSDEREEVLKNMGRNCQKNEADNIIMFRLNLAEYKQFLNKYDVILCNEILKVSSINLK